MMGEQQRVFSFSFLLVLLSSTHHFCLWGAVEDDVVNARGKEKEPERKERETEASKRERERPPLVLSQTQSDKKEE